MEMSWQGGSSLLLTVEKRTNDSWNQNGHGSAAKREPRMKETGKRHQFEQSIWSDSLVAMQLAAEKELRQFIPVFVQTLVAEAHEPMIAGTRYGMIPFNNSCFHIGAGCACHTPFRWCSLPLTRDTVPVTASSL